MSDHLGPEEVKELGKDNKTENNVTDIKEGKEKKVNKKVKALGGVRQGKKPTKAEVISIFNKRVFALEKQLYDVEQGMMQLFGRLTQSINSAQEKLEEDTATTKAFHNIFLAKKILKDGELRAEVERKRVFYTLRAM